MGSPVRMMPTQEEGLPFLPAEGGEMGRINNGRDVIMNAVVKAIDTGAKENTGREAQRQFYIGRTTAFVHSAASAAHLLYGAEFNGARSMIAKAVKQVHENWPNDHLRDEARVGQEADAITTQLLDTVW